MSSPLPVVSIAVAVVLGVGAVPLDPASALLDARSGAPPVVVLLVTPPHPPCVWCPIWGKKGEHKKQKKTASRSVSLVPVSEPHITGNQRCTCKVLFCDKILTVCILPSHYALLMCCRFLARPSANQSAVQMSPVSLLPFCSSM